MIKTSKICVWSLRMDVWFCNIIFCSDWFWTFDFLKSFEKCVCWWQSLTVLMWPFEVDLRSASKARLCRTLSIRAKTNWQRFLSYRDLSVKNGLQTGRHSTSIARLKNTSIQNVNWTDSPPLFCAACNTVAVWNSPSWIICWLDNRHNRLFSGQKPWKQKLWNKDSALKCPVNWMSSRFF